MTVYSRAQADTKPGSKLVLICRNESVVFDQVTADGGIYPARNGCGVTAWYLIVVPLTRLGPDQGRRQPACPPRPGSAGRLQGTRPRNTIQNQASCRVC